MNVRWYGKPLAFFGCRSKTGKRAVVMHTTPDGARNMLKKAGIGEFETATLIGGVKEKPTIIAVWEQKADIEEKGGQQKL